MKKLIALFITLQITLISQGLLMDNLKNQVALIKQKYAPDKRTAIFNIELIESSDKIEIFGETNIIDAKNELINFCKNSKINYEDKIITLPISQLGDKIYGIVNLSVANIRTKPDHPEELATQSLLGTVVKVYKNNNDGFYLIQTPDEYIGWVDDDGLVLCNYEKSVEWKEAPKIIFTDSYGILYSRDSEESEPVSDLVAGNLLLNLGETNKFYKAQMPDGRVGFIKKEQAKSFWDWLRDVEPSQKKLVTTAKRFLGVPYLWGGTSTKGMDCSGFTKTVYFLNGVILPRDASQQVNAGELINTDSDFSNLQPGDLLFFGKKAHEDKKERITHVAMYIGNDEFIHSSGRVRINSLNPKKENFSEYRLKSFIRAKRIITSIGKNGIQKIELNLFYK